MKQKEPNRKQVIDGIQEEATKALNKNVVVNLSAGSDDGGGTDDGGTGSGGSTTRLVGGSGDYTDRNQSYSVKSARWKVTFQVNWTANGYVDEETNEFVVTGASFTCIATFIGETYPKHEITNGDVTTTESGKGKVTINAAQINLSGTSDFISLPYTTYTYENGKQISSHSEKAHCKVRCNIDLSCMGSKIYANISFAFF